MPLSVVSVKVACAAARSSIAKAKVMITGAAMPTVAPLGIWNEARMVFWGLMVFMLPLIGDSVPSAATAIPSKVYLVLKASRSASVQVALSSETFPVTSVPSSAVTFSSLIVAEKTVNVTGSVGETSLLPNFGLTLTRTVDDRPSDSPVGACEPPRPGALPAAPAVEVTVTTSSEEDVQPERIMAATAARMRPEYLAVRRHFRPIRDWRTVNSPSADGPAPADRVGSTVLSSWSVDDHWCGSCGDPRWAHRDPASFRAD